MQRICTAAEIKFYFSGFYENGGKSNYLRPNKNCNLTSWTSGCEPGWACSAGADRKIDLSSKIMPSRVLDCHRCCAGFFCPHGITCMIRKIVSLDLDIIENNPDFSVYYCLHLLEFSNCIHARSSETRHFKNKITLKLDCFLFFFTGSSLVWDKSHEENIVSCLVPLISINSSSFI